MSDKSKVQLHISESEDLATIIISDGGKLTKAAIAAILMQVAFQLNPNPEITDEPTKQD